jgi:hypothetical protein
MGYENMIFIEYYFKLFEIRNFFFEIFAKAVKSWAVLNSQEIRNFLAISTKMMYHLFKSSSIIFFFREKLIPQIIENNLKYSFGVITAPINDRAG